MPMFWACLDVLVLHKSSSQAQKNPIKKKTKEKTFWAKGHVKALNRSWTIPVQIILRHPVVLLSFISSFLSYNSRSTLAWLDHRKKIWTGCWAILHICFTFWSIKMAITAGLAWYVLKKLPTHQKKNELKMFTMLQSINLIFVFLLQKFDPRLQMSLISYSNSISK